MGGRERKDDWVIVDCMKEEGSREMGDLRVCSFSTNLTGRWRAGAGAGSDGRIRGEK